MIVFKTVDGLNEYLTKQKKNGATIGFVPTMGALHQGHLSLIEMSKKNVATTVCSIFVNPTQFNDRTDFEKYPITIEQDILLLEKAGCDVLFLPSADEIYPHGTALKVVYELGYLETILEGKFRPNHFQGVCQVVHRLLEIVQPTKLFLGQKDYQQCMVIKKMIELTGIETELQIGDTLRGPSGLALSSRNMRLSEMDKHKASFISQSLMYIKNNYTKIGIEDSITTATNLLNENGFTKIDYIAICNAATLQPIIDDQGDELPKIALIAAFLNDVRLIDNMLLPRPTI